MEQYPLRMILPRGEDVIARLAKDRPVVNADGGPFRICVPLVCRKSWSPRAVVKDTKESLRHDMSFDERSLRITEPTRHVSPRAVKARSTPRPKRPWRA